MYEISRYVDVNEIGTAVLLEELAKCEKKDIQFILAQAGASMEKAHTAKIPEIFFNPNRGHMISLIEAFGIFWILMVILLHSIPTPSNLPPQPGSIYAATNTTGNACNYSLFIKKKKKVYRAQFYDFKMFMARGNH